MTDKIGRIDGKTAKALTRFLSTDRARPKLGVACVREGKTYATNGHLLAAVPLRTPDGSADLRVIAHPEWILGRDVLGRLKAREHLLLDLQTGELVVRNAKDEVVAALPSASRDGDDADPEGVRRGPYPDVSGIVDRAVARDAAGSFQVQARYLRAWADLAEELAVDELRTVTLEIPDARGYPAVLRDRDGRFLGLAMPVSGP